MDKLHYARVAATGWVFLGVLALVLWTSDASAWREFITLVFSERANFPAAAFGVVAGIGGPPIAGFFLDRFAALLLYSLGRNLWQYRFTEDFAEHLRKNNPELKGLSAPGLFHAFFYTYADPRLIDWFRRRTNQVYSAATMTMTIVMALLAARFLFKAHSWSVTLFSSVVLVLLICYAELVSRAIEHTGMGWANTIGKNLALEFDEMRTPPRVTNPTSKNETSALDSDTD